jgi:hypothetical protein
MILEDIFNGLQGGSSPEDSQNNSSENTNEIITTKEVKKMARNFVEYHIQEGAFHTFKVSAGQTIRIGQMVEIVGDRTVGVAGAGSTKAIGVVYSGSVGKDGLNTGYVGDEGDVVTVVALKPLVYLEAGEAVTAGDVLVTEANGTAGAIDTVGGQSAMNKIGLALEGATAGERFLAMIG